MKESLLTCSYGIPTVLQILTPRLFNVEQVYWTTLSSVDVCLL